MLRVVGDIYVCFQTGGRHFVHIPAQDILRIEIPDSLRPCITKDGDGMVPYHHMAVRPPPKQILRLYQGRKVLFLQSCVNQIVQRKQAAESIP